MLDGPTGVIVSLSEHGTSRSMLTDRGVGPLLTREALADVWLADADLLHLPAYSLVSEPIGGAARAAAARVPRLSIDLSSTAVLRDYGVGRFRALLGELRPQVVFGTEDEADLVGEVPGADLVVKLGAAGRARQRRGASGRAVRAVDPTGAGDAFAAGYLLGGVSLGLAAAARAVATMGAMP